MQLPIRPGEQGRLNLRGLDQFNNPAYIIVRLSDNRVSINNGAFSQAGSSAVIMANSTVSECDYCITQKVQFQKESELQMACLEL